MVERLVGTLLDDVSHSVGLDTTAVDELVDLDTYLESKDIRLLFAEMKGPIKDRLVRFGVGERFGVERFFPTIEAAVAAFERRITDGKAGRNDG